MHAQLYRLFFMTAILATVTLVGCGHTNNLSKYDITGKTALIRVFVSDRGSAFTSVESPNGGNLVADIATMVGSTVIGDQAQKRLQKAIDLDSISENVGKGIWQSATDYLGMQRVQNMSDDPDYIVETEVKEFQLGSSASGMIARVDAKSRVIDRRTGGLVWEDSHEHTINLTNTQASVITPQPVQTGAGVFNAVQLLRLSDEEIRTVLNQAAEQAGRRIGESLRKDVAKMNGR